MRSSLELVLALLTLVSLLGTGVMWYRGVVQKSYAAERDFQHLKRNQEQMAQALAQIVDVLEEIKSVADRMEPLRDQVLEIKAWLIRLLPPSTTGH